MVLFTVKGKEESYPFVVLNGYNFYLKIQEIMLGKNKYRYYFTANEDIKNITIEVNKIDIESEEINRELREKYLELNKGHLFTPIRDLTMKNHYSKISMQPNFDFYQNLRDTYSVERLTEMIWLLVYRNVSKEWLCKYFNIDRQEVEFLMKYLPVYYNYLDFGGLNGLSN